MRDGLLGGFELTAVRKRIWRAIENARKQGPRRERQWRVIGDTPRRQRCSVNMRHGFFDAGVVGLEVCGAALGAEAFGDSLFALLADDSSR